MWPESLLDGLDGCGHAAFAASNRSSFPKAWICSRLSSACSRVVVRQMAHRNPLPGNLETSLDRMPEDLFHHQHDIIVAVIRVIPEHNVVAGSFGVVFAVFPSRLRDRPLLFADQPSQIMLLPFQPDRRPGKRPVILLAVNRVYCSAHDVDRQSRIAQNVKALMSASNHPDQLAESAPRHLEELMEWLRIPSVSSDSTRFTEVKQAASWVADKLEGQDFPSKSCQLWHPWFTQSLQNRWCGCSGVWTL